MFIYAKIEKIRIKKFSEQVERELLGGKHPENDGYDNEKGLELQVQFKKGNFKSPQNASTFTPGQDN